MNSPVQLLAEPGALRVLKAYARTTSPRVALSIAKLVESIADREMAAKASDARPGTVNRSFARRDSLPREARLPLPQSLAAISCLSRNEARVHQAVARIASRSRGMLPGMNSPIQSRRAASICHDIASAEDGAGSGMSLRISLPSCQPQLCE